MAFDIPGITFLEKHEKLVIVIAILIFGVFAFYKGESILQTYQQNKATQLEQQLQQTKEQTAAALQAAADAKAAAIATQQQAAQDKAASAAIISALTVQNAALTKNIVDRDKQTQQQQQIDLTSTIPELGKRFLALVPNINPADMKVADDQKSVTIGQDTAQKTAAQLELIPDLQADVKNLQTEVANDATMLASSQKALDSESKYADIMAKTEAAEEKYAALLQTQIDQGDKLCNEKIDIEKTKGKKSFLKGGTFGTIFGFILGVAAHAIGL